MATIITPIIPAAASGVRKPSAINTPLPTSVVAASRACQRGQRIPMPSNHVAVPLSPPAPKNLL